MILQHKKNSDRYNTNRILISKAYIHPFAFLYAAHYDTLGQIHEKELYI